jgi:hypothetical protein
MCRLLVCSRRPAERRGGRPRGVAPDRRSTSSPRSSNDSVADGRLRAAAPVTMCPSRAGGRQRRGHPARPGKIKNRAPLERTLVDAAAEGVGPGPVDLLSDFIVIGQPVHESTHDRNRARRCPSCVPRAAAAHSQRRHRHSTNSGLRHMRGAAGGGAERKRRWRRRSSSRPRRATAQAALLWPPSSPYCDVLDAAMEAGPGPDCSHRWLGPEGLRGVDRSGGTGSAEGPVPRSADMSARRDTRRVRRPQVVHIYGPPP